MKEIVDRLQKLDQLDELIRKVDKMSTMVVAGVNVAVAADTRSTKELRDEMEQLQNVIFNDNSDPKERETANIKFDKLYTELISTEEYKREMVEALKEKRRINEPINKEARARMMEKYSKQNITDELRDRTKARPELLLIGLDAKAILSKHQSDYNQNP